MTRDIYDCIVVIYHGKVEDAYDDVPTYLTLDEMMMQQQKQV